MQKNQINKIKDKKRKKGLLITDLIKENHLTTENDKYTIKRMNVNLLDTIQNNFQEKNHSFLIKNKTYNLLNKYLIKNELINDLFKDYLKKIKKVQIAELCEQIAKFENMNLSGLETIEKKKELFFNLKYNDILIDKSKNEFICFMKVMKKRKIDLNLFLNKNEYNFKQEKIEPKKNFNILNFKNNFFIDSNQIEKSYELQKFVNRNFESKFLVQKPKLPQLNHFLSINNNILTLNKNNKENKTNFSREINLLFHENLTKKVLKKQNFIYFKNLNLLKPINLFHKFQEKIENVSKKDKSSQNDIILDKLISLKNISNSQKIFESFKTETKIKNEHNLNLKNIKEQELLKKKKIFKANVILYLLENSNNVTKIYKFLENLFQIKNKKNCK